MLAAAKLKVTDEFSKFGTTPGLYVAQFNNGLIKVGRAANPQARLRQHAKVACARIANGRIVRAITTPCPLHTEKAEAALIARMERIAVRHRKTREFFSGVSYWQARQLCRQTIRLHHYKYGRRCDDIRPDLLPPWMKGDCYMVTTTKSWPFPVEEWVGVAGLLVGSEL